MQTLTDNIKNSTYDRLRFDTRTMNTNYIVCFTKIIDKKAEKY